MKFVLVKAVAVLAACTSLVGVAEAKYLGNFTIQSGSQYDHYPSAREVANEELPTAKYRCKRRFPNAKSVSLKSYWKWYYSVPGHSYTVYSNWNCFDTSTGT